MRKNVFGRQFKRDANERKALFKNLLTSLVMEERIKTSTAKAKAIKAAADKLITKAKKALPAGRQGGRDAYRALEAEVNHHAVIKLIDDIAPRFAGRAGGYTRIIKIGNRVADNAPESVMEWTEKKVVKAIVTKKETSSSASSENRRATADKEEKKETPKKKVVAKKKEKKETKKK